MNNILKLKREFDLKFSNIINKPHKETIAFDMHIITKYCQSFSQCKECDFYKNNDCYFKSKSPKEWI